MTSWSNHNPELLRRREQLGHRGRASRRVGSA